MTLATEQVAVAGLAVSDFGEACTYWAPNQTPNVDTGTAVTATVSETGIKARFFDEAESTTKEGSAQLLKAAVTLTQDRGCWGVLRDSGGRYWTIREVLADAPGTYLVRLSRMTYQQLGSVRQHGGRRT